MESIKKSNKQDDTDVTLSRWIAPSFSKMFQYEGVIEMIIGSCLIFFKFRVVSKNILNSNFKSEYAGIIVSSKFKFSLNVLGMFPIIFRIHANVFRLSHT